MIKHLYQMTNKQITQQQNLRELARLTLLNILSAKGLYYQKYQRLYQQKHQSDQIDYLPKKS
jgi:hypothetical protein